ncbi:hypothetical protein [Pyxidicoccus xibeiensis]|uniref:hypothetical protein n=1 Tax=Pyxidicoccus xibeiensis TaxID=2906759 RepID=UPI0020A7F660|nr:hypothetical protein [Pyxidicoccus xibeiensis]MCP3138986.1 hypothetical protein [Pyxidicoccus xibeiensis]
MMRSFVTVFHREAQVLAGLLFAVLAVGCGGSREDFIGPRVKDTCDASWPVCSRVAGCILGTESYSEGRFPGRGQFIVQAPEAATVKVSFFLEDVTAAGEETVVLFHEEGCRARTRQASDGRAVLDMMEKFGEYTREADVTGVGDHLIEFESDMQARYVVKVDVTPLRNR